MSALKGMNVAFRVDASLVIGTGHVMRCLTLANALRDRGAHCLFICRAHEGHLGGLIVRRGHELRLLPPASDEGMAPAQGLVHAGWLGSDWQTDAEQSQAALGDLRPDWLVVDHYALDARWTGRLRPLCEQVLVIDDIADRPHDADILVDANLGRHARDYDGLVPAGCRRLIGSMYALLREEFTNARAVSMTRRRGAPLHHLLISMGGIDRPDATGAVLDALGRCRLPDGFRITVVMGGHAPHLEAVRAQAEDMPCPVEVRVDIDDMAAQMVSCDLAVGAAGSTSWERCCLGLPSLMVVLAENQQTAARALDEQGSAILLGEPADLAARLCPAILRLAEGGAEALHAMVERAAAVTDGLGTYRIVDLMQPRTEGPIL